MGFAYCPTLLLFGTMREMINRQGRLIWSMGVLSKVRLCITLDLEPLCGETVRRSPSSGILSLEYEYSCKRWLIVSCHIGARNGFLSVQLLIAENI